MYGKVKRRTTDHIICNVTFDEGQKSYYYLTEYDGIEVNDFVIVPAGQDNHEAIVKVVNIECFNDDNVPLPIDKIKHIICKCTEDSIDEE